MHSTHIQDGLLFLGSRVGNSQVLALPPGTLSGVEASAGSGRAGGGGQQAGAPLRWHLASPALIKSLAPVHDCVEVPDANGEGLSRLTPDLAPVNSNGESPPSGSVWALLRHKTMLCPLSVFHCPRTSSAAFPL